MRVGDIVFYWGDVDQPQPFAAVVVMTYGNPMDRVNLTVFGPNGVPMPKLNVSVVEGWDEIDRYPMCMEHRTTAAT